MANDFRTVSFSGAAASTDRNKFSKVLVLDHSGGTGSDFVEPVSTDESSLPTLCKACRVTDPQLNGSFTRGGYVTYLCSLQLNTEATHAIRKRYSDFLILRSLIQSAKPGVYLPQLPPKSFTHKTESRFLESRRTRLELFLRSVLLNPDTGTLSCVTDWAEIPQSDRPEANDLEDCIDRPRPQSDCPD